jgi:hypothetical protein
VGAGDDAREAARDVLAPSAIEVTSSSEEAARVCWRLRLGVALGITVNQNNKNERKLAGWEKAPSIFKCHTVSGNTWTIASTNDKTTFRIIVGSGQQTPQRLSMMWWWHCVTLIRRWHESTLRLQNKPI